MSEDGWGWQPIATAPTDGTFVWVYVAAGHGLPSFQCTAAYDPYGGWCCDELRETTHWARIDGPPPDLRGPKSEKDPVFEEALQQELYRQAETAIRHLYDYLSANRSQGFTTHQHTGLSTHQHTGLSTAVSALVHTTSSTLCERCNGMTFYMDRGTAKMCQTCCPHRSGRTQIKESFGVHVGRWSCLACGDITNTEKG